jgi:hypothetical protein
MQHKGHQRVAIIETLGRRGIPAIQPRVGPMVTVILQRQFLIL